MGCYVVAIGGTGNKILESMVYLAAVDGFYTLAQNGEPVPLEELRTLSVDVDSACGNTTRAKRAAEAYEELRAAYQAYPGPHSGFHTAVRSERWNMNLSRRAASVDQMVRNHRQERLLSRTLFSKTESALEYSEGFRGHPDLGVLFFADMLDSLKRLREEGQPDEMNRLTDEIRGELERGEGVKLILCGSIFGGTGASGIPSIAKYLREAFADDSRFEMGAMLMLPYYKVPPASRNEELEIVVKSSAFLDKARTALQYYGMEGLIRDGEEDQRGIFDALYMLGLPPDAFITTRMYSTGSQSQENDAHMLEWLAARCAAAFFRTGFRGAERHHIDCYYYQLHTPQFCWQSFDQEEAAYRRGYGGLLKTAAVFFSECYPTFREAVAGKKSEGEKVGYCAPYLAGVSRESGAERARLEGLLNTLYQFLNFYANWMIQVVRTLPPPLREKRESETLFTLAEETYDRLTRRRTLLAEREGREGETQAQRQEYRALREEYEEMQQTRSLLVRQIGGLRWLEVLKSAQEGAREEEFRQEQYVAELGEQVARWQEEESLRTDPQKLRQEQQRLEAMKRVLHSAALRREQIGEDIENAIREDAAQTLPEREEEAVRELPPNALVEEELMEWLYRLLTQYGLPPAQRDGAVMARACLRLQKGLNRLVRQRVPDRQDMSKVVAGLGGGSLLGQGAEGKICSFLTTLMGAVEEDLR